MKRFILFFAIALTASTLKAQSGYNYHEWGVGLGLSYERGYTNITQQNSYLFPNFNFNVVYNFNPFLPIEAEIQTGHLSGGGLTPNLDPYGRMYENHFIALIIHSDFQLGAGIDFSNSDFLNFVKNFYAGTGLGLISNSNKVQRTSPYDPSYIFPGHNNSLDVMVPIRVGYEIKLYDDYNEPEWAIDMTYIHNFAFGEGLDGYDDPSSKFKNNAIDQYRQFNLTVKFYFGNVVSYNKLMRNFN